MNLSPRAIKEFQELHKALFGYKITDYEAQRDFSAILKLVSLINQPGSSSK